MVGTGQSGPGSDPRTTIRDTIQDREPLWLCFSPLWRRRSDTCVTKLFLKDQMMASGERSTWGLMAAVLMVVAKAGDGGLSLFSRLLCLPSPCKCE